MKVTIRIEEALYRRLKAAAALRGRTVREVTTELYERWLAETEEPPGTTASEWLDAWFAEADDALRQAPPGCSAREELARSRSRLERE